MRVWRTKRRGGESGREGGREERGERRKEGGEGVFARVMVGKDGGSAGEGNEETNNEKQRKEER